MSIDAVTRILDVPFAAPGGHDLSANLYLPGQITGRRPVILWLHGGGWRLGDRTLGPDLARHFASRGFAIVSVDYRLSSQAVFPAQVEDVKTAIRWVRHVADAYGLDRDAIGLFGSSAGGHLAALAGLSQPGTFEPADRLYGDHGSDVHAVADGYGPTDILSIDAHRTTTTQNCDDPEALQLTGNPKASDPTSFESSLIGAPIESRPDLARRASPLTYVVPGRVPFLILHGRSDAVVPEQQSRLLYDALAAAGREATLCLIEGLGHGFLNRTTLDDGGLRTMEIHRHHDGRSSVSVERRLVFPTVEDFFTVHLARGGRRARAGV